MNSFQTHSAEHNLHTSKQGYLYFVEKSKHIRNTSWLVA